MLLSRSCGLQHWWVSALCFCVFLETVATKNGTPSCDSGPSRNVCFLCTVLDNMHKTMRYTNHVSSDVISSLALASH